MRFWRKRAPSRAHLWRDFADRLELADAATSRERLRDLLDLGPNARLTAVYGRRLGEGESLLFFDYEDARRGPAGSVSQLVSGCLLQSKLPLATVSLRASPKLHPVLESLGASASGGQRLSLPDGGDFNERVTVYARRPEDALELLQPAVREVLLRTLCERQAAPTLLVGEHHLVLTVRGAPQAPTDLAALEEFSTDLLSLYAALAAVTRSRA